MWEILKQSQISRPNAILDHGADGLDAGHASSSLAMADFRLLIQHQSVVDVTRRPALFRLSATPSGGPDMLPSPPFESVVGQVHHILPQPALLSPAYPRQGP